MKVRLPAPFPALLCLPVFAASAGAEPKQPLHDWDLSRSSWEGETVRDAAAGKIATAAGPLEFGDAGELVLEGETSIAVDNAKPDDFPVSALTAEALVEIDRGQAWGAIIAFAQDNGAFERGWLLGYDERAFVFWVSTGGAMISITSRSAFEPGSRHHVAGTFDGRSIRIYVDGKLEAEAPAEGEIVYPPHAVYTLGAYHDDDEHYPMSGKLHWARVYGEALGAEELAARTEAEGAAPVEFEVRPALRFVSTSAARVTWESREPGGAAVAYGKTRRLGQVAHSEKQGGEHAVLLEELEPHTVYYYKIELSGEGGKRFSPTYEVNTALNFARPAVPGDATAAGRVGRIIERAGVTRGYGLVLGGEGPGLALELARRTELNVILVRFDAESAASARHGLYEKGAHGSRVTVLETEGPDRPLPITSRMVNLLVSDGIPESGEMRRVLVPGRGKAVFLAEGDRVYARPPAAGEGEWSHQYGDSGNTAASAETLAGAGSAEDFALQWVGRPGADFGIDRNPRMPAPLAAGGRLYHQGMNRLAALDARNGAVLWAMEAPGLRRVNIPRDSGNWCADADRLYVAIKERVWVLDGETGRRLHTLTVEPSARAEAGYEWGYLGRAGRAVVGSAVRPQAGYTSFWSGKMWYDGKGGEAGTEQVCSDSLFAYAEGGDGAYRKAWVYEEGVILNPTIAIQNDRVYFVETRNAEVLAGDRRRIAGPPLWIDQHLVALDLETGEVAWERPLDTEDGTITFYLQCSPDTLFVCASNTEYHLYAFDPATGEPRWQRSNPWPDADHSGHFQHPVIAGSRIYLQPNGYDAATGEILTAKVGRREGCHTYVGAGKALIYRGESRRVSMWDSETETVSSWPRLRPSCWLSTIPAAGMLLMPEGGGGCSCGGWMETSVGFLPRVHLADVFGKEGK